MQKVKTIVVEGTLIWKNPRWCHQKARLNCVYEGLRSEKFWEQKQRSLNCLKTFAIGPHKSSNKRDKLSQNLQSLRVQRYSFSRLFQITYGLPNPFSWFESSTKISVNKSKVIFGEELFYAYYICLRKKWGDFYVAFGTLAFTTH